MACAHCGGPLPEPGWGYQRLTIDGDAACSEHCKEGWEAARDRFFDETVHCSEKTEAFLMGCD